MRATSSVDGIACNRDIVRFLERGERLRCVPGLEFEPQGDIVCRRTR